MPWTDSLFPFLKLIPKSLLSRTAGAAAHARLMPRSMHHTAIRLFAKTYGITLDETKISSFDSFETFEDFFIRELRPGARPLGAGVVAPCDGVLDQCGPIQNNRLEQIKGFDYTVDELLMDAESAQNFYHGTFATLYLSPRHYHRVHCPHDGFLKDVLAIPGDLWPVNQTSVRRVPRLFCKNERVVCFFDNPHLGRFAVIFVGATIVGHIHIQQDPTLCEELKATRSVIRRAPSTPTLVLKGDELGYFTLGSTVILLFEKSLTPAAPLGADLRYGSPLFVYP